MPRLFKTFLLLFALTSGRAVAAPPDMVAKGLRDARVPQGAVSILVQEVGARRPSLALNADASRNPGSVMKLVTTYAALELLGPAYRWKTEVYRDGEDIILKGTGDPKLNYESFWMLLRNLRSRGVRELRGDILLDRSYFGPVSPDLIDNEVFRPYNVTPDALLVNFKSLRVVFFPEDAKVRLFVEPHLPGLEVVNALKISDGQCPEGRAFRDLIQASFQSKPPRAAFTGFYPVACGERDLNVALHHPEDYVAGLTRALWTELGGTWSGRIREGVVSPNAKLLYAHESEPLSEIVRDINKFSNNVMARQLYLTLAAELGGAPAQPEAAGRAIAQWLVFKGVNAPELKLENGSGLSRHERASAATLMALLQAAWKSPVMPELMASLPVVAADGTMRKRMHGEGISGNAHIKTGLLSDTRAIGGYVLDRSGRRHAVVMIANHPNAPQAEAAFDALLQWIRSRGPATGGPRDASPHRP
ncbi:MAG TPA: D-alanyl-D-alanine carboxypeptidase/D-alanyl-D-alanine-endopeptidase [Burkholderiales bacterium]|nr:D-alanyl-D-alanine carboxypeptidase/D-alanyl-D-alanine-endopeptidase [Burkholderiales bacterium]